MGRKTTNGGRGSSKWHSHMDPYAGMSHASLCKLLIQEPSQHCLNEQYDRGYIQGQGDDIVRFVSCRCPKCNPRI